MPGKTMQRSSEGTIRPSDEEEGKTILRAGRLDPALLEVDGD